MTHLFAVCSIGIYIAVTAVYLLQLWRPSKAGRSTASARIAFMLAFALHTVTMGLVALEPGMRVLDNGADYFLWVSWATALVFFLFRRKLEYPIVGAFVVPVIIAFMGSSSYLLHAGASSLVEREEGGVSVLLSLVHAVPALVSVVSLAMALIVSAVFLIVDKRLKRRPAAALLSAGPDLQLLDRLNRQLVQIGFVAISLVVVSGGLWAVSERKPIFSLDTSVISGLAVWLLLACILHARLVLEWSPRQVSRFTVVVTASFFVSVFVVMAMAGRLTHALLWS
jgi:ABC-type transport system involved in cytochrome c biogenesis permease subunit